MTSGLLQGKQVLITGVITEASIASRVTSLALAEGAEVLLTAPACRVQRLTSRVAARLGVHAPVLELDVELQGDLDGLAAAVRVAGWDRVDGVLHAIAHAAPAAMGTNFAGVPWSDVASTVQVSAWSLAALTHALDPLLAASASIVGLDFDASRAWPGYDWMGVAKAGLEATSRYLARDLGARGIRVNLVAAGPLKTLAARGVPGFAERAVSWDERAPLGWDSSDAEPAARAAIALLSDWFPATTGEIVHVDGGFHAMGG